ncbi:acyl-CoA dehydrogenase family protein [Pseudorhodoferax sp.]|uniref:acyl-CoA dehydrogenase family protein n=1 Tax=Pseudorhodoferax sp. TaxID=1993553 RepID=UPI002DD63EB6|nr:acyl-CoA dehydrogenase family protein [Pseudorhodoferax sp.]
MDLEDSPEDHAFREGVRQFIARHRAQAPAFDAHIGDPRVKQWQQLLVAAGYLARTVPKAYGGAGCSPDPMKSLIIAEEFAAAQLNTVYARAGILMFLPTLLELGTAAQKEALAAATLAGELVWCQGYSEPQSGSDLASLSTRAHEDGDDFVLNGQKIWTSYAHVSNMMFALVRTEPGTRRHEGISYLYFSMRTPGIETRPLMTMTGKPLFNEVFFTDVRVPQSQVIGQRGQGWKVANTTLRHERSVLGNPWQAVQRLEGLVALMRQETRDGRRCIDDPVLRDRLMQLSAQVEAMKQHELRLTTADMQGQALPLERLVVKLQGTQLNYALDALAIDCLGDAGTLYDNSLRLRAAGQWPYRLMQDLGFIIGGGTAQIQRNIIGERGLGLPRSEPSRTP